MVENEDYKKALEVIATMEDDHIQCPKHIPVAMFIGEADLLHRWVQEDKELLITAGLDWSLVENLPSHTLALVKAEAQWDAQRKTVPEREKEWKTLAPKAIELRNNVCHHFRFAFHGRPDLLRKVKAITSGRGYPDLIQDLNDILVLSKGVEPLLAGSGFDMSLLEEVKKTGERLPKLYARVTCERKTQHPSLKIRNKIYTLVKQAVDEIRRVGRFALHGKKDRLKGYWSRYLRHTNQRQREKKKMGGKKRKTVVSSE